jgi:ectoine hydroxylase-related dioxygenase (phytanoyl-CoA dioxygenase family)
MLKRAEVERFQSNGYLAGIRILDDADAAEVARQFNQLEAREGEEHCEFKLLDPHFTERFAWDIATHSRVLDCVESVIGPDIFLMATHFFCKYGPRKEFVGWHQDVTYWGLEPPVAISAWYAVDDSDAENGCMQVVPGTHREGIREHGKALTEGNLLSINQEAGLSGEEAESVVDVALRGGEISLHDGLVVHGSPPNLSQRRRCGLTCIYLPGNVRQGKLNSYGEQWSVVPLRGGGSASNLKMVVAPF